MEEAPKYKDKKTRSFADGERVKEFQSFERQLDKRSVYLIHPGEVLREELEELKISPAKVARELHVPANRLYQLIAGKRAMTADTALRLEKWLGVSADFWMNLQKRYELDLALEGLRSELKEVQAFNSSLDLLRRGEACKQGTGSG